MTANNATSKALPLFQEFTLGSLSLRNRSVMAPMTRSRAIGNVPNELMAEYYAQRAEAGLIITEGTSPSPNGLGYPRIPGIFSREQVAGWSKVTRAVHELGGTIFVQLMHTGRVSHPENLPDGARVLAPSAVELEDTLMWVDERGEAVKMPPPEAMTDAEVRAAVEEYVQAARNAVEAGFDGIELHGANGYLMEQFLHPHTNRRDDAWGGSMEKRCRFVLEAARRCAEAIGADRVGIRLSPYGVFNEMPNYDEIDETYTYLAQELGRLNLVFIHIVDHEAMGAPSVPKTIQAEIRKAFPNAYILSGGYGFDSANADLEGGKGDLVAFGRPYLANPDLLERLRRGEALNQPDMATFYAPGPEGFAQGYTDYPTLKGNDELGSLPR